LSRLAATSDLPTLFGRSFSFTPKRHTFESQGKFRSEAEGSSADAEDGTKCRVDNALSIYLEGIKEQKRVMEEHKAAFEVGKRHIANIMGLDPEHLTQVFLFIVWLVAGLYT
jgi:hypothetical protein